MIDATTRLVTNSKGIAPKLVSHNLSRIGSIAGGSWSISAGRTHASWQAAAATVAPISLPPGERRRRDRLREEEAEPPLDQIPGQPR